MELHDFSRRTACKSTFSTPNFDDDTILSSIPVHCDSPSKVFATNMTNNLNSTRKVRSCRSVLFSVDGNHLYTAGNTGGFGCLDTVRACSDTSILYGEYTSINHSPTILWKIQNASPNSINVLHQLPCESPAATTIVTGDDEGLVRLWDVRICSSSNESVFVGDNTYRGLMKVPLGCILSLDHHDDYISALSSSQDGTTLLICSADGTLSAFDIRSSWKINSKSRTNTNLTKSYNVKDELLSLTTLKHDHKIVVGSHGGSLNIWSWGEWQYMSDIFPGHAQSIDAILKIDEDTIMTGCSDGVVRIVQIHPNKVLGVLGHNDGFPVEDLSFSAGRKFVGSLSHDNYIRLWDASVLCE